MSNDFFAAVKNRRSVYTLSKDSPISDQRIEEIIKDAINHVPSPFNSQSSRAVLLLGAAHDELWEHAKDVLRGIVQDPTAFAETEKRINGFKAAKGSVIFFEDQNVVKGLEEKFASYKDNFQPWSAQSSGMLQFAVWTAFSSEGLGANLQHYSPLVDEWIYKKTGVPKTWRILAQMTFGKPTAAAGPKEFSPVDARFKVVR